MLYGKVEGAIGFNHGGRSEGALGRQSAEDDRTGQARLHPHLFQPARQAREIRQPRGRPGAEAEEEGCMKNLNIPSIKGPHRSGRPRKTAGKKEGSKK